MNWPISPIRLRRAKALTRELQKDFDELPLKLIKAKISLIAFSLGD